MDKYQTILLTSLVETYREAKSRSKYCLFFDKTDGNVTTFFLYKGLLKEFNKEIMKVEAGRQTIKDACENFRDGLVNSMRYGSPLSISMANYTPDFKSSGTPTSYN